MRREALLTLGVVFGAATMLWLVFWLRGWPDIDPCGGDLTPGERREVDDFRRGHLPLHAFAGLAVAVMIWRLTAAFRNDAGPGRGAVVAVIAVAVVVMVSLAFEDVLIVFVLAYFFSFALGPLTLGLAVMALALLASKRRIRAGATLSLVVAWLMLGALVPAHYMAVRFVDEPLCMS